MRPCTVICRHHGCFGSTLRTFMDPNARPRSGAFVFGRPRRGGYCRRRVMKLPRCRGLRHHRRCVTTRPSRSAGDISVMSYTAESIAVLKGLEPVRHRPGMYTRTDCPLHIIQEAIDNAADEALGGYCKRIAVTSTADHSVTVRMTGVAFRWKCIRSKGPDGLEVVFTRLHAGGKFNKDDGASAYRFSGGLHGVGVSVTNALSTRLEVEVVRDGARHQMAFAGGAVVEPLRVSAMRRKRRPARACARGRTRVSSIRRRFRCRSSNVCCAARRCCCPVCRFR
jgi:hypothetical protein